MARETELLDQVIDKLARDVEMAVHALYRGDVRQNTVKARTEVHRRAARDALAAVVGAGIAGTPASASASVASPGRLDADEVAAITRCILAWLPMGTPASATPESRCVPGGRELIPTWADRERARQAARRLSQG